MCGADLSAPTLIPCNVRFMSLAKMCVYMETWNLATEARGTQMVGHPALLRTAANDLLFCFSQKEDKCESKSFHWPLLGINDYS